MEKKKKYRIITIRRAIGLALLCFLGVLKIYNHLKIKNEAFQAQRNASDYIFDKYGFEPEFNKISKEDYRFCDNNGYLKFDVRYQDTEFVVISDCSKKNSSSIDNYQYDEIKDAVAEEILSEYPAGKLLDFSVCQQYGEFDFVGYSGFTTYYNGSNLDDVITDCFGNINMIFSDTDFSDIKIAEKLKRWNIDFEFTSLDTKAHMDEMMQKNSSGNYGEISDTYKLYKMYAPHITDHIKMKSGEISNKFDIDFQKCEYFTYSCFSEDDKDLLNGSGVNVEKNFNGYLFGIYQKYGEEEYVSKPILDEFCFRCTSGDDVYVYYSLDSLKDYDIDNIGVACYSNEPDNKNNRQIKDLTVCGDYAVFCLPYQNTSFGLVDTSAQ